MNPIPRSNEAPSGVYTQRRIGIGGSDDPVFTKLSAVILILVVALFVFLRLWHLTAFSLWTDEIFSLSAARLGWGSMLARIVQDWSHPPLFYVLLKMWIAVGGQSLLWLKLFPALTAIATLIPLFFLCRQLNLRAAEINLAVMLMAVNGYLINYAQELRMYSLLVFVSACSFWLFARFVNSDKKNQLLALTLLNLLLVYVHYFGWLVIGIEGLFLILWERRKFLSFCLSAGFLVLCYSPWVFLIARTLGRKEGPTGGLVWWIKPPHFSSILAYFATLSGPLDFRGSTYLRLLLFGGPVLLWLRQILRGTKEQNKNSNRALWLLLISVFLPLVLVYFISVFGPKSIWLQRQLIIVAIPFMLLIATAVHRIRPTWLRLATLLLIVSWATLGAVAAQINRRDDLTRIPWASLIDKMTRAESSTATDIKVFAFERNVVRPVQFYLAEAKDPRFQGGFLVKDVTAVDGNHFWIAFRELRENERGLLPQKVLTDKGYHVGEAFEYGPPGDRAYLLPVWAPGIDVNGGEQMLNSPTNGTSTSRSDVR